jgi:hypothetical protein
VLEILKKEKEKKERKRKQKSKQGQGRESWDNKKKNMILAY